MMRDEAFHFTRIGTFLERADSTARILTAHQSDLMPGADAGVVPDPYAMERAAARPVGLRGLPARVPRRHHALSRSRSCSSCATTCRARCCAAAKRSTPT